MVMWIDDGSVVWIASNGGEQPGDGFGISLGKRRF